MFVKAINTVEPLHIGRVGSEERGRCREEIDVER